VHRQKKPENLSDFQIRLTAFADNITKLRTIKKLVDITNGQWRTPLDCSQAAVNEAGSAEFPFGAQYRELAASEDNDIELVTDQYLPQLLWQPVFQSHIAGSTFLHRICTQVLNQVNFF
jgi:hypothetical protein